MSPTKLHVVVGAGALGTATAAAAVAAGHAVRMVSRSGTARSAPDGVEVVAADAADPARLAEVARGAAAVHHCASQGYTNWATFHPPVMRSMIAAAGAVGAVLVNSSNLYVYGKPPGPMSERTPERPVSRKGAIRRDIDALASAATPAVTLRAPDFYGVGAGATTIYGDGVFGRIVQGRRPEVFGRLDQPHCWVDVADFGRAMVLLADSPQTWGRIWHLPCPAPLTQADMLALIADAAGRPARPQVAPAWALRAVGLAVPLARELAEMAYQWRMPYTVDHSAFDARFPGWTPTPHEHAVATTVDWFRNRTG